MENEHVLGGLIRKRAEIAGALEDAQNRVRQLITDLDNVDGTIRVFAPEMNLAAVRPKALPVRHAAFKGEIMRAIYAALRGAPEPLTTREMTFRIMAVRSLNITDLLLVRMMHKRVGAALRKMETRGRVAGIRENGREVGWRMPG